MHIISKQRHELKTAPSVAVTIKALTEKKRLALVLATAEDEARLYEIRGQIREKLAVAEPAIMRAKEAVEKGADDAVELTRNLTADPAARGLVECYGHAQAAQRRIDEALLKMTVLLVEGFSVDGEVASLEGLIEYAPAAVFAEVVALAKQGAGMTEEELGNSESPITLAA